MTAPSDLDCLTSTCEMAVLRALELAGKRAFRRPGYAVLAVAAHERHTHLPHPPSAEDCDRFLREAWDHLRIVRPDQDRLITAVDWYVRELLTHRRAHTADELRRVLAVALEPA